MNPDEIWCNLSAYESNRMLPGVLSDTELGRDLLDQDVMLKGLTASLLHPDNHVGREYWKEASNRIAGYLGTSFLPISIFQKVWIKPAEAQVYETKMPESFQESDAEILKILSTERGNFAYVTKAMLGVHSEEDIVALQAYMSHQNFPLSGVTTEQQQKINEIAVATFREVVIPVIEEEVNERQNFRKLRQIFASCILSKWFRDTFSGRVGYKSIVESGAALRCAVDVAVEKAGEIVLGDVVVLSRGATLTDAKVPSENPYQDFTIPLNRLYYSKYIRLFHRGLFDVVRPADIDGSTARQFRRYSSGAIDLSAL